MASGVEAVREEILEYQVSLAIVHIQLNQDDLNGNDQAPVGNTTAFRLGTFMMAEAL